MTPILAAPTRRRSRVVGALLALALAFGLLPLSTGVAMAAPGDYTVDISAPATVPFRQGFAYDVTLEVDATPDAPATGIVLTTVLAEGLAFDSVPTGGTSPVQSSTYDPATRTVTFTLKAVTEQLSAFAFSVTQVGTEVMDQSTVFDTAITGSTTPSGAAPGDSAQTSITGDNDYRPVKWVTTLVGSGNRIATYSFDVGAVDTSSTTDTFWTYAQRLTDTFPAGVVVQGTSPGWVVTTNGDGSTTAVWERNAAYSPWWGGIASGSSIWITVAYPESTFPAGSQPPLNTVGLETSDRSGTWFTQQAATAQGPTLGADGSGEFLTLEKGAPGLDAATWGSGNFLNGFTTAASYISSSAGDALESMTVTDAAGQSAANAEVWDHFDAYRLSVGFNGALEGQDLPYTIGYTTSASPGEWQSYTPTTPTTSVTARINVATQGSTGFQGESGYNQTLTIPQGARLTGWRIVVSPDEATTIASGSEVRVQTYGVSSYTSLSGGAPASAPMVNTATLEGTSTNGAPLSDSDPLQVTVLDRVNVINGVSAPSSIAVGSSSSFEAWIVNVDPAGRTYDDASMRVVLPVGVYYDAATGASATATTSASGRPVPQVGAGVTVTTDTVTDAEGEHQVVVFSFDELESVRTVGTQKVRNEGADGYHYTIPVTVQPQAYTGSGQSVAVRNYATTLDADYTSLPFAYYGTYYGPDAIDIDPNRATVPRSGALTRVITAGGLLLGKLVRAEGATAWAPQATVATPGGAEWQVYAQNVLPNPVSDIVLFDRLPVVDDGRDSDFAVTLTGAVAGAPAGSTVEYSTDATTAGDGTWSTDPMGATAFRVSIPSLATNANLRLTYPTTVPAGLDAGELATNDVTATGIYGGSQRDFFSTEASITPAVTPGLTVVKATNGVHYETAPGAIVGTGSEVTWTYTVTNSGNTPLDDIQVSDTFTADDGSTGTFTATSTESGPLAPGASRTFTATGTAIAGQYANTATASGSYNDGELSGILQASDSSWYLAGDTGLSIAKTTNGEDVTSAPGLPLLPGSDVAWAYTVTNTGSLDLTDVLVEDVDADGTVVFSDVVASLPAGESVTLTATGTAIEGQYRNTVTASADDPSGASDGLTAADDSWYFGVVSSISIDKTVGASESGPFGESVTVASGAAVWWQFVVTNTGNAPLTGVVITDTPVGDPIEVGDLAPGERATVVVRQGDVSTGYTNVATVDGADPTGAGVTDDDGASVDVTAAPSPLGLPNPLGLPRTGSELALAVALLAAALLGVGAVLLVRSRKRRAER